MFMARNMSSNHQIIFCTCPNKDTAEKLARLLVSGSSAACVNILPGIMSIYRWNEQIETDEECLLLIKAHIDNYSAIETIIHDHHPYELPEIIAVSITNGLPEYLQWITSCHSSK